jgi:hypothetical protein
MKLAVDVCTHMYAALHVLSKDVAASELSLSKLRPPVTDASSNCRVRHKVRISDAHAFQALAGITV